MPGSTEEIFRKRWRQLISLEPVAGQGIQPTGNSVAEQVGMAVHSGYIDRPPAQVSPKASNPNSSVDFEPSRLLDINGLQGGSVQDRMNMNVQLPGMAMDTSTASHFEPPLSQSLSSVPGGTAWSNDGSVEEGLVPWFFADSNPLLEPLPDLDDLGDASMNLDGQGLAWYNWMEFAKGMERDGQSSMF
jgi:hypothetical protein